MDALAAHVKEKGNFPPMHNDALMENYPGLYQSLLQIIHNTGERVNRRMEIQNQKWGAASRTRRLFTGYARGRHRYHALERPGRPQ